MSDEKKYTERDLVMAKREGFLEAHSWARVGIAGDHEAERLAATKYPLPKRTQRREAIDPHTDSRVWSFDVDRPRIVWRWKARRDVLWTSDLAGVFVTPERVALWADLIANPTEEVDDEK